MDVIGAAIVDDPVIEAVHAHGNIPVAVIETR